MLATLILAALTLVYAFSFCTGSIAYAFNARSNQVGGYRMDPIKADALFEFVQGKKATGEKLGAGFNSVLIVLCIVYIVITVTLFITSCQSRRNYYITNYVATALTAVFGVVLAIYTFVSLGTALGLFNQIDFEQLKWFSENNLVPYYSDSRATFIIGFILFTVVILNAVVLVLNLLWKIKLMKGEKALLAKSNTEEVAQ